jgi:hypothetical protein
MMYKRKGGASELCVLRISLDVLDVDGVVLTDCNASSNYVRFLPPKPAYYRFLDFDDIFAMDWRHPEDPIAEMRHRSRKCAEVLVPHLVQPRFIIGARVVNEATKGRLEGLGFGLPIAIDPGLFFR